MENPCLKAFWKVNKDRANVARWNSFGDLHYTPPAGPASLLHTEESWHLLRGGEMGLRSWRSAFHSCYLLKAFLFTHRRELTSFGRQLFQPVLRGKRKLKSKQRVERQHKIQECRMCRTSEGKLSAGHIEVSLPQGLKILLRLWPQGFSTPKQSLPGSPCTKACCAF